MPLLPLVSHLTHSSRALTITAGVSNRTFVIVSRVLAFRLVSLFAIVDAVTITVRPLLNVGCSCHPLHVNRSAGTMLILPQGGQPVCFGQCFDRHIPCIACICSCQQHEPGFFQQVLQRCGHDFMVVLVREWALKRQAIGSHPWYGWASTPSKSLTDFPIKIGMHTKEFD